MKGVFWNCRGAGKKGMSTCLTDMINANEVDFLGLQETMKSNYTPSFFRKLDPHQKFIWEWIPSRGNLEVSYVGSIKISLISLR